jgi:hypothetical protein
MVAMMVIAGAMLARMPVVRRGSARRRMRCIGAGLRSRVCLRGLPCSRKNRRCQSQYQNTRYLFH